MLAFIKKNKIPKQLLVFCVLCFCFISGIKTQSDSHKFKVIAFYTAKNDQAHISFVHEANSWFSKIASKYNLKYDSTNDWNNLNTEFLSQ